jgi:hypothetical protein
MKDAKKLAALKSAVARVNDAIMRDPGGFSLLTLHALNDLCEAAGFPDYTGVTAVTNWTISGEGEENVRFFGAGAHVDASQN